MSSQTEEFVEKRLPLDAPNFRYDEGQSFKLAMDDNPEDYWYVKARLWNYDADPDDALVMARAFKQYIIGTVSSLGADEKVVTEDVLFQHYETVSRETAKQVLDIGDDDDDGRDEPTRSEPADFGHGDSTGVQDL